ncbi:hypothetical protein EV178_005677 [Coemansia sp. RSA 1646]|nr:hypothetical protein EV178_005677 [Coemansia sp. RSA 1646]KAJ2086538.1 hypothetical protein IW138_005622 [Coemansia sp. RSA 986]
MKLLCIQSALFAALVGASASNLVSRDRLHEKLHKYPSHVQVKPHSYIVQFEDHIPSSHADNFHAMDGVQVGHQYVHTFNGISVSTSESFDPLHIAGFHGVKYMWPVKYHSLSAARSGSNGAYPFQHGPTGVEKTIKELGITGKNVKIGIVDSGVDYTHPELGNCWKTEGCMWQYGADFVGDNYSQYDPDSVLEPNPTPMDQCNGHGTHVSGIIAAQGPTVRGVAPDATLGMYRIFSCPGASGPSSSSDDIIMKGVESAVKDKMDIINLSLGGGSWAEDPLAVVCTHATMQGITIVAAAGNDGEGGLFTVRSPSVGEGVLAVGSVDNWNMTQLKATITNSEASDFVIISSSFNDTVRFVFDSPVPLAAPLDDSGSALVCTKVSDNLSGKVAVVDCGSCSFIEKAQFIQDAGAVGMIVVNTEAESLSAMLDGSIAIPVVSVLSEYGKAMRDAISRGPTQISAKQNDLIVTPSETGGQVSSYSSHGPDAELNIFPHVLAPGGDIYSTYPTKLGSYKSESGTSMATPYVAGAVALLKQARPGLTISQIGEIISSTAQPLLEPGTNKPLHPYKTGSGLLNVYNAIQGRARISPPRLSINSTSLLSSGGDLGVGLPSSARWTTSKVTIENTDSARSVSIASFTNNIAESLSMYNTNGTIAYTPRTHASSAYDGSAPSVYVSDLPGPIAAEKSATFSVAIVAPEGLEESEKWFYGGQLVFKLQWEQESTTIDYTVPYAGFNGDSSKLDPMAPPSSELPAFMDYENNPIADPSKLVVSAKNEAIFAFEVAIPSRLAKVQLVDSTTNKVAGYLPDGYSYDTYKTCPMCAIVDLSFVLNGTVYTDDANLNASQAPAGKYHISVEMLRPFGDKDNSNDYQKFSSPDFQIA